MTDKFCTDCKHSALNDQDEVLCEHEKNYVEFFDQAHYLATGVKLSPRMVKRAATAHILRIARGGAMDATTCGPDGKWFEVKGN